MYANQKMLENLSCIYRLKAWFIVTFAIIMTLSCTPDIENLVGPSYSGYTVGLTSHYGGGGIIKSARDSNYSGRGCDCCRSSCKWSSRCSVCDSGYTDGYFFNDSQRGYNDFLYSGGYCRNGIYYSNSRKRDCDNHGSNIEFLKY